MKRLGTLVVLAALALPVRPAFADIPSPDRKPHPPRPERAEPAEATKKPMCGVGIGLVVLGLGAFGAWRFGAKPARERAAT